MRIFLLLVTSVILMDYSPTQTAANVVFSKSPVRQDTDVAAPAALPADATAFPQLKQKTGTAYQTKKSLIIALKEIPKNKKISIPRMANVVESIRWIGGDPEVTMAVKPEIDHWIISLVDPPVGSKKLLELQLDAAPLAFDGKIITAANDQGVFVLPAKFATTFGEKLRYEPQPHKNTVGYWAVAKDHAEWHLKVAEPGHYDVEILQGCGKGHGGSDVEMRIGDQKLAFQVLDTGHFQNFKRRALGQIEVPAGKDVTLKLVAIRKAAIAVMDCREIRLTPAK